MNKKKIKIIGFIPAKKNSIDLKNKNLKKLNNLSLFELAILAAKRSKLIDQVYISSDSEKILKKSKQYNINTIKRKKILSTNSSSANSVILDFIKNKMKCLKENFIIVYLQPTSPFRNNQHIDESLKLFLKNKFKSVLSVTENKNFYKSFKLNRGYLKPYFDDKLVTNNRQNLEKIYSPNGAIYIFFSYDFINKKKINFMKTGYYIMNRIHSIDIDNLEDYELAKYLSKKYLKFKK
tara:strand:- start:604 stop:1311 length:708 start_codon:yes stop_codon:yes gene_type:complete